MTEADEQVDPYRVLQVDPAADQEVVQAAYRALARQFHPDVAPNAAAADRMAAINAAFDLIRDAERRAAFDREHGRRGAAAGGQPATSAGTAAGGGGAGSWSATRQGPSWEGTAGPPPGRPLGSVLGFGRFKGWSLGEIARVDPGYLQWLEEKREGLPYRTEIDDLLRRLNLRKTADAPARKRGPFRRS
ncbi:MAG: DnaJ domain-containing protein [Candidatus Limnocylindrales bacterium]